MVSYKFIIHIQFIQNGVEGKSPASSFILSPQHQNAQLQNFVLAYKVIVILLREKIQQEDNHPDSNIFL
jgi:hypothetical protein